MFWVESNHTNMTIKKGVASEFIHNGLGFVVTCRRDMLVVVVRQSLIDGDKLPILAVEDVCE